MMGKNKLKLQCLVFDKKHFNRATIKVWVGVHGFTIDKRLRKPVMPFNSEFRVRQRNPAWFNKKTFIVKSLGKGVKGVYGKIKR